MKKNLLTRVLMVLMAICLLAGCNATPASSTDTPAAPEAEDPAAEAPAAEAPAAADGDTGIIKIGMVMPLTGPNAESGLACVQGVTIAAEEINANGGVEIDGKKHVYEIVFEDDQGTPAEAVSAAQKLLTNDQVDILLSSVLSSCGLAIMEICPDYPDVLFSTVSCASDNFAALISAEPEKYFNFYKPYWNNGDYAYGAVAGLAAIVNDGHIDYSNKTVCMIIEDTDFGRGFGPSAEALLAEHLPGTTVLATEYIEAGVTDFYATINKFKSLDPDVVITCTVAQNSGVAYVKQVQELGVDWIDIGVSYPMKFEFKEQGGSATEGFLWVPFVVDFENNEVMKAHKEKVLARYPDAGVIELHAAAYDVMNMINEAVIKAGTINAKDGLAAAYGETDYVGLEGRYVFKDDHTAMFGEEYIPCPVAQVQNGEDRAIWPASVATSEYMPKQ